MRDLIAKHPFIAAFIVGAIVLTVLPFAQGRFLRAPEPIASLGSFTLVDDAGAPFGSADLKGTVWLASFVPAACDDPCRAAQADFGKILDHIGDLSKRAGTAPVLLVTIGSNEHHEGRWKSLHSGSGGADVDTVLKRFSPTLDLARAHKLALVDQNGDVRGFWDADELGRGNLINAARLIAKLGPRP